MFLYWHSSLYTEPSKPHLPPTHRISEFIFHYIHSQPFLNSCMEVWSTQNHCNISVCKGFWELVTLFRAMTHIAPNTPKATEHIIKAACALNGNEWGLWSLLHEVSDGQVCAGTGGLCSVCSVTSDLETQMMEGNTIHFIGLSIQFWNIWMMRTEGSHQSPHHWLQF